MIDNKQQTKKILFAFFTSKEKRSLLCFFFISLFLSFFLFVLSFSFYPSIFFYLSLSLFAKERILSTKN